jgi:hypothetical protein
MLFLLPDLFIFIKDNYYYGNAEKKVYSLLNRKQLDDLKTGFYTDLSENNRTTLYELYLDYKKNLKELENMEIQISNKTFNTYFISSYEIKTDDKEYLYLIDIVDNYNMYTRCDYFYDKPKLKDYLFETYNKDKNNFPKDLILYI